MPYYPKSQVKTDLYTKGGQFQLKSTKQEYIGYYWKNSRGDIFTKKNPNVEGSEILEIIPQIPSPSLNSIIYAKGNDVYNTLKNIDITKTLLLPTYSKPSPTDEDYAIGNFTRYFAKKINENIYIEISKNIYNKFKKKDKKYACESYLVFELVWTITGDVFQVEQTNKNIIRLTEQNNRIIGLEAYLKFNYLEFYGLYTKGGEYKLPNGQIYIGLYHIHPDKGAMVGRIHISTPHDRLIPISQSTSQFVSSIESVESADLNPTTQIPFQSVQQENQESETTKNQPPVPRPRLTPTRGSGNISGY